MALKQRARRDEDKQLRREAIVKAARALLERSPRLDTTVAEVAERAGVAKGTIFLYFATREAIELAVLQGELEDWFDAMDRELAVDGGGKWTAARVTQLLVSSVLLRKLMIRLLGRLEATLEHNVPVEVVEAFKRWLLGRVVTTGRRLEERLPILARDGGSRFVLQFRALITGLWMMSDASPTVAKLLADPEMAPLRVDFERELEAALGALLRGLSER